MIQVPSYSLLVSRTQTLSSVWRLSIRDYKRAFRGGAYNPNR